MWHPKRRLEGKHFARLNPCPACACLVSAFGRAPNLVRHVSAFSPPSLVHLVSALRHLQTLSAMCPPYVRFGFPRKPLPPCLAQALCLPVGFGRASKRCVSHVGLCVRHVSAPCLFFVLPLSARCSLFIRSLSVFGRVYGLALAGTLSALLSALWFLCLCLFCVRCCLP